MAEVGGGYGKGDMGPVDPIASHLLDTGDREGYQAYLEQQGRLPAEGQDDELREKLTRQDGSVDPEG